ncbi:B-cell scaffold protein with ankyrin repeats isoform X1 [Astyanax mexicanus]|uniref:B-cell scaffold protein with ankyrin repeats isoform X1 n=1 Tax=Astyanax mexicanus TaxID=7994 RepID=UPI0020CAB3C1|nr:B-cell scaffold protein with ankyrin repeats isoform X1 [Astyanax mexicanus]
MSKASEDLLIIYESEAEQWASYLRSLLADSIPEAGICCYDIGMVTSRRDNFLQLSNYKCKLLILSRGMLEGLCQLRRFFLAHVLRPEARVVVLLCGVDSLTPLLELIPLKGEECLLISSEQDAQEYRSAVAEIVRRGGQTSDIRPAQELNRIKLERKQSAVASNEKPSLLILPSRVPCENPGVVFLLLQKPVGSKECEVEFSGGKQRARVKAASWNENTLSVAAADFPAGSVGVTLYCGGAIKAKASLYYYSRMGEIERLLKQAANPMNFMWQAFRVSSKEELDQILASSLMRKMPAGGFQGLLNDQTAAAASHSEEIPTLLHFAAQHGLKDLASAVLQCPGAQQALRTRNRLGHTPLVLAHSYGHSQLHVFLQESLALSSADDCSDDASVYELMGSAGSLQVSHSHDQPQTGEARDDDDKQPVEQEEDPYAHLGANDEEYDSILTSGSSVAIVNRPPAPTPRPETLPAKEDNMPFIAQVFQKKKSQADSETLYSFSTKQNRGRDSISCTYDTFMPNQPPGLDELIKLQEQVKKGSLSMDEALDRFTDWQRLQRGLDSIQQEKLKQLRQSIISNREDDDSVYDKINIVHHTPSVTTDECRRGSQQAETDFYSKPLKGQNSNFFWKADKR